MSLMSLTALLLKRPADIVDRADERDFFAEVVPRLLLLVVLGAAVFGAVVGAYRGGLQVVFAAVKLPVLFLVPLLVALPAVRAIAEAAGAPIRWPRLALAALTGIARTSVIAAALSPAVWLLFTWQLSAGYGDPMPLVDYHLAVLLFAGAVFAIGLPMLSTIAAALPASGLKRGVAMLASAAVLGVTLAQTGWLLRPFVARPTTEVTFLRPVEEDIFSALAVTGRSAMGVYREGSWGSRGSGLWRDRDIDGGGR
ncbi:MAG: hypothetical protein EP330_13420 [Deltaproteobacteria bacterium]|nr:MAG: hypothetical protein EP330_13420 [Deltaproteobacteria bacterium]